MAFKKKEPKEKKEKISMSESWRLIHNFCAQNEALFQLRDCLERGKEVEDYLKKHSQDVDEAKKRIDGLTSLQEKMKEQMEAALKDFQAAKALKIADLEDILKDKKSSAAMSMKNERRDYDTKLSDLKAEIVQVSGTLDNKKDDLRKSSEALIRTNDDLAAVRKKLASIKEAI